MQPVRDARSQRDGYARKRFPFHRRIAHRNGGGGTRSVGIFQIHRRSNPLNDVSRVIAYRERTRKHAVETAGAGVSQPVCHLADVLFALDGGFPLLRYVGDIVRMNPGAPIFGSVPEKRRLPRKFVPAPVEVRDNALPVRDHNHDRKRVGKFPETGGSNVDVHV